MATCGSQFRPSRKSTGETIAKKRSDSNSSESTMPSVVTTASKEQSIIIFWMMDST